MQGFLNALSASFVLLMLMAVGYFMGHKGWMSAPEKKFLNKYIMNIAVPCNCMYGLLNNLDHDMLFQAGRYVLSGVVGILCTLLCSIILAQILKLPKERWGVFVAMTAFSNVLFIGLPVCTQLFGQSCVPYVMMYYLGNTTFVQSVGVMLIQRSGSRQGIKQGILPFLKGLFLKPPIVAVFASIVMLLLGLRLPGPVMTWGGYISNTVSPLALIYCGYVIYELGLKNLKFLNGLPVMLVVRLAVAPLICIACCEVFQITGFARSVFVVESALPVVSQITVMAGAYGADEQYAAVGSCLSIFFSFLTIPILMLLLG